jgi:hypothetical protein
MFIFLRVFRCRHSTEAGASLIESCCLFACLSVLAFSSVELLGTANKQAYCSLTSDLGGGTEAGDNSEEDPDTGSCTASTVQLAKFDPEPEEPNAKKPNLPPDGGEVI